MPCSSQYRHRAWGAGRVLLPFILLLTLLSPTQSQLTGTVSINQNTTFWYAPEGVKPCLGPYAGVLVYNLGCYPSTATTEVTVENSCYCPTAAAALATVSSIITSCVSSEYNYTINGTTPTSVGATAQSALSIYNNYCATALAAATTTATSAGETSPIPTQTSPTSSLTSGTIGGIVVGALVAFALILLLVLYVMRKNKRLSSPQATSDEAQQTTGKTDESKITPRPAEPKPDSQPGIGDAYRTVLLALAVVTIPLTILSFVLLGLILRFRVSSAITGSPNLQYSDIPNEPDVYYVDFSATSLTTVGSWTSSVAPQITSSVMVLFSFYVASGLRTQLRNRDTSQLPTPYQLTLLLELFAASISSLWGWLKYYFWRHRNRGDNSVLRLSVVFLAISTCLSYVIWGLDTWFHVATTTVQFLQITPVEVPTNSFGRVLSNECVEFFKNWDPFHGATEANTCIVAISGSANNELSDPAEAFATINNISAQNQISTISFENHSYTYLGPANPPIDRDFRASTIALHTDCEPVSQKCNLTDKGLSQPFNCSPSFSGDIGNFNEPYYKLAFFNDSSLSTPLTQSAFETTPLLPSANPFYIGFAVYVIGYGNLNDSQVTHPVHGGDALILQYKTTVYNFTYSSVNGSVLFVNASLASVNVSALMIEPLIEIPAYGTPNLQLGVQLADLTNTSQEFADTFAGVFEQVSLGMSVAAYVNHTNLEEQVRSSILVARVPKAPLFTLIAFNFLFVFFGLVAFTLALKSQPRLTRDVQARLSVIGLVANQFEGERAGTRVSKMENLFGEHVGVEQKSRVGLVRTDQNGWEYRLVEDNTRSSIPTSTRR